MATATETFTGFRPEAIQFLADLAANNDRAWFQPRKAEYERLLKQPLEALCVALAERFEARGLPLTADPVRSPFRIYRDVRFSKDKSPYKTQRFSGLPVERRRTGAVPPEGDPGGYFHLEPGEAFVGGGMWHPPKEKLAAFRSMLDANRVVCTLSSTIPHSSRRSDTSTATVLPRPAGLRQGPSRGRTAEAEGHDIRPSARGCGRDVAPLPDVLVDSFEVAVPVMRFSLGCDARRPWRRRAAAVGAVQFWVSLGPIDEGHDAPATIGLRSGSCEA